MRKCASSSAVPKPWSSEPSVLYRTKAKPAPEALSVGDSLERLFPGHPAGFEFAHDHPLPQCDAEWVRAKGGRSDRMLLHFPGGAYILRLPNMERSLVSRQGTIITTLWRERGAFDRAPLTAAPESGR